MRVEIPAYTDRWMMGDRYGEVVKIIRAPIGARAALLTRFPHERDREVASVRLDKSGKTVRVVLADCREV